MTKESPKLNQSPETWSIPLSAQNWPKIQHSEPVKVHEACGVPKHSYDQFFCSRS